MGVRGGVGGWPGLHPGVPAWRSPGEPMLALASQDWYPGTVTRGVRHGAGADAGGADAGTRRPWAPAGGVQRGRGAEVPDLCFVF